MNRKPYINKTLHAPLMTRFVPLHMQDLGQYSIKREASASLQLQIYLTDVHKRYTNLDI